MPHDMCHVKVSECRAQEKAVIARPTTEVYFRGSKFWQQETRQSPRAGLIEAKGENGKHADHLNVSIKDIIKISKACFKMFQVIKGPGQDGGLSAACEDGARKQARSALNAEVANHGDISHLKTHDFRTLAVHAAQLKSVWKKSTTSTVLNSRQDSLMQLIQLNFSLAPL